MLIGRAVCVATWLLACCILYSEGGSVTVVFAESDASGSESDTTVIAPVRMSGDNDGPITLEVVPLTVDQYLSDSETYEQSCDMLTNNIIDKAEVEDFNAAPISQEVQSDATDLTGSIELDFRVPLVNDNREEQKESLLLWLNASTSDNRDSVTFVINRRCIRVDIAPDQDAITLNYSRLLTEVSEGAGTVEFLRITKQGETELTKKITFSESSRSTFTVSPRSITLQPEDTTAMVSIVLMDDDFPEDDSQEIVTATTSSGGFNRFEVTIKDNDYVAIGFDQTELTVMEGEMVTLTTSFKNITHSDYLRNGRFEVFTSSGKGNATAPDHYSNFSDASYFPGDSIEIPTVDDDELETSRHFEVRLRDPTENPLNILNPNHVTVTILDNDGTPNTPRITGITFNEQSKGDISVIWKIETHKLRPVHRYVLIYSITETKKDVSKTDDSDSGEIENRMPGRQRFNVTIPEADVNCKLNATRNNCKHIIKLEGEFKTDITHNVVVMVCAENEFDLVCGEPASAILMPAPLSGPDSQVPRGISEGVIIAVVVAIAIIILLCCLLWTLVAMLCGFCGGGDIEKKYHPEKREKENEEQLKKYRESESPAPVDV